MTEQITENKIAESIFKHLSNNKKLSLYMKTEFNYRFIYSTDLTFFFIILLLRIVYFGRPSINLGKLSPLIKGNK